MKWMSLVVSCAIGVGSLAMAETPPNYFNYYVSNYPAPAGGTCDATAKSIGDQLHAATGVTIWAAQCLSQSTTIYSMRIVYEGAKELSKISTLPADTVSDSPGVYDSMDDCAKDLATQTATFHSMTGLAPVVSYCSPQPYFGWSYPVALVIEAFGTPTNQPFQFKDILNGVDDSALPAILQELNQTAASQNLHVYNAVIGSDDSDIQQLRIGYYAQNQLPIYLFQQMEYPTYADCAAQLADVRHGLGVAGDQPLTVFCEGGDDAGTLGVVINDPGLKFYQAPQPYASMDACNADRSNVLQSYKNEKLDARYSLCQGHDANEFYMYILERQN